MGNVKKGILNICKDCGKEFFITDGEQRFYEMHNLLLPKRCTACRIARRKTVGGVK